MEGGVEIVEGDAEHGVSLGHAVAVFLARGLVFAGFGVCGCVFGVLEGFGGVLMGLHGELVGGEVVAFAVGGGGGLVGVGGFVVELGGAVVGALGHLGLLLAVRCGWFTRRLAEVRIARVSAWLGVGKENGPRFARYPTLRR